MNQEAPGTLVPPAHKGIWNSFTVLEGSCAWPQPGFHGQELLLTYTAWFSTKKPQFLHFRRGKHHIPKPRHPSCTPTIHGASRTVSWARSCLRRHCCSISWVGWRFSIVTQDFYSSIIFGVKKTKKPKKQWRWVGFFCAKLDALMKKRLLFSIFCCLFLLGALETHNFCQRNISPCLSEFLQCQLGAVTQGLHGPLSPWAPLQPSWRIPCLTNPG